MGRLSDFRYRQIVKKLKAFGFEFFRHAAGSHEIGAIQRLDDLRQSQAILVICQKALYVRF